MKARVVLYNPLADFYTMPLALIAVASHLDRERFEPVIVDGRLESDPVAAVVAASRGALCLGVTVLTGAPIRDAVRISRAVKAAHPGLPIIWGGWHPSMFSTECLDEPSVDATVQGQGEATFAEIVDRLARGQSLEGCLGSTIRSSLASPPPLPRSSLAPLGTAARDGSGQRLGTSAHPSLRSGQRPPIRHSSRPLEDVNAFSAHDYSLIDVERYYRLKGKPQLDYIASQGCRFRCSFCADPFVFERRWVGLIPERIGHEIETLWRRYRFTDVNFQDETFFTSAPRVQAIAEQFVQRGLPITWAATMRADQCARLDESVLEICKRSGLRRVLVGVESGSPEMLKRIKKDITVEQVMETAHRCLALGIKVRFPFIVGFPDEDEASFTATLDLARRLSAMSPDFETVIFYYKPYPGSAITEEAVKRGYQLPRSLEEWSDFDYVGSRGPWVSPDKYHQVERFKESIGAFPTGP